MFPLQYAEVLVAMSHKRREAYDENMLKKIHIKGPRNLVWKSTLM